MSSDRAVYPTIAVMLVVTPTDPAQGLRVTLETLFAQSSPLDQLVLLVRGSMHPDQRTVIADYEADARVRSVEVIPAPDRHLAKVLNTGIAQCSTEWVSMLRAGDEVPLDRLATQREYIARRGANFGAIGGWVEDRLANVRVQSCPVTHDAIVRCLRWQSVLFDGSVIFRADKVRAVDGFRSRFPRLETWDLCVRLALAEATFAVIPKVMVRTSGASDDRRGLRCLMVDVRFQAFCWKSGFISLGQYLVSLPGQAVFRLIAPIFSARSTRNQRMTNNA